MQPLRHEDGVKNAVLLFYEPSGAVLSSRGATPKNWVAGARQLMLRIALRYTVLLILAVSTLTRVARADSGWSWQNPVPTAEPLWSVVHLDFQTIIAVGNSGTILKSIDGGATWTPQSSGITGRLEGVCFADANTGSAVGLNGIILGTNDGGATWTPQSSPTNNLISVSCTDANTATAVGYNSTIIRTTDGGSTWTPQPSGTTDLLLGVFFTDANTGFAV
jgi:photosystem II stability/assembly factor-like uncharacterized protein